MTCTPPWMQNVNTAPWNAVQSAYPRTVSVLRAKTIAGADDNQVGAEGYSGNERINSTATATAAEQEASLFSGLIASIQLGAAGRTTVGTNLPGDSVSKPIWKVFIPSGSISQYSIRDRDIILDDEGYRYQVSANYWTDAGYELSTVRLEA